MADLDKKIRMVAVAGPTASGKTALGIGIAKAIGGEVISCDSMQIYRGMSIATAAPTTEEMQAVPHHLVEFLSPDEEYSVAQFCADANKVADQIASRGAIPVLVGGTGLYMNSFTDNITFSGSNSAHVRQQLQDRLQLEGAEALLKELASIDGEYAAKLHLSDTKRITRALELYYADGITMTEQVARSHDTPSRFDTVMIGITFADREKLYDRINRRVDIMLQNGLLQEAKEAYIKGGLTAAQAIGHKELFDYFDGTATLEECVERLKMQTRRYAKRQLSWFRRDERIHWIYADNKSAETLVAEAIEIIDKEWKK